MPLELLHPFLDRSFSFPKSLIYVKISKRASELFLSFVLTLLVIVFNYSIYERDYDYIIAYIYITAEEIVKGKKINLMNHYDKRWFYLEISSQ